MSVQNQFAISLTWVMYFGGWRSECYSLKLTTWTVPLTSGAKYCSLISPDSIVDVEKAKRAICSMQNLTKKQFQCWLRRQIICPTFFCTSVYVWISISYSSLNLICVFTGSVESVESGLTIENNSGYNKNNQNEVGMLPLGPNKISSRNHIFNAKTVIRPEDCDVCEKR